LALSLSEWSIATSWYIVTAALHWTSLHFPNGVQTQSSDKGHYFLSSIERVVTMSCLQIKPQVSIYSMGHVVL
jgi:hypothetical protein